MKKHYETHVEDTDKLISVAGPILEYKSWYEQYRKLMEEQAQRKYGLYTPTSEGDDDDFPSITGMIARYSALGLTNEQMAANPVWVDKTGNGHDLQMKNLAWGGMSGVNGYKFNFLSNEWVIDNNQVSEKYSYKIVITIKKNSVQFYRINSEHIKIILKITGIEINKSTFRVYDNAGTEHAQNYTKDGIYEIDYTANEGANMIYFYVFGGNTGQLENPITIEQLPLYPGALVFDGVDDWAGCDNLPLLPKEKGYSIIALRNWITRYDATQYKRPLISNLDTNDEGAFLIEYRKDENVNDVTGSYNSFTDVYIDDNNPITWQTSSSYNGQIIKKGTSKSTNKLCICKTYFGQLSNYANAAIWEIVILDHDATEEELTKIKDYFVKTYPWLFPDQAWTVTGKTNEDEDRATIANITGNSNDLVLSNFGFIEGSGYNEEGEYAGYPVTDGVDDEVRSGAFTLNEDWTIVGNWEFITNENKNAGLTKVYSLYLYNRDYGIFVYKYINAGQGFSVENVKSLKAICSDGRIYLNDWQEIRNNIEQEATISKGVMAIGYFNRDFTKMAFKNLGIYNNQLLSKDDCIKAYNYLQTLKAK